MVMLVCDDLMGHGVYLTDQGGFLVDPDDIDELLEGLFEFYDYHGRKKIQEVCEQQREYSCEDHRSRYPPDVRLYLYPNDYEGQIRRLAFSLRVVVENGDEEYVIPAPRIPDRSGYVYVLRADNGLYKIGWAKILDKRIKKLEIVLPYELELIVSIQSENALALEGELHKHFADKRKKGEWFNLEAEDIVHIKSKGKE